MFYLNSILLKSGSKPRFLKSKQLENLLDQVKEIDKKIEKLDISSAVTGRYKKINQPGTYKTDHYDSQLEYFFRRYFEDIQGAYVIRNKTEWLPYFDLNGKSRKFYPDFIVNGTYYEVKGIWRPNDFLKIEQCPQVEFYDAEKMKDLIIEVKTKIPSWSQDYIPDF